MLKTIPKCHTNRRYGFASLCCQANRAKRHFNFVLTTVFSLFSDYLVISYDLPILQLMAVGQCQNFRELPTGLIIQGVFGLGSVAGFGIRGANIGIVLSITFSHRPLVLVAKCNLKFVFMQNVLVHLFNNGRPSIVIRNFSSRGSRKLQNSKTTFPIAK